MNCRPGDLAVCIRAPQAPAMVGRIFRVTQLTLEDFGIPHWETSPEQFDPTDGRRVVFADIGVRPIRDPGEDARDETLSWLPVPSKTKETA